MPNEVLIGFGGAVIGSIITIIGSHYIGILRDKGADLKSRVGCIEDLIRNLQDLSVEYWSRDLDQDIAKPLERDIKKQKKEIKDEIDRLKKSKSSTIKRKKLNKDFDVFLVQFFKYTNGTIDTTREAPYFERNPHQADPKRISKILELRGKLVTELRNSFGLT
ncbi:hypothetical protein [Sneathiella limimaris]|uniref:hypothetical protein n=1 Tax=Sneathiella limimaris TaxID=1964213 RepID=UPI00146B9957|nr:hypothetical protein [Sneathiella limimaris]